MKLSYTSPNGRLAFEVEVASGKMAFEVVAAIQELFEEPCCGLCKSENIRCEVRTHDENKYYSLVCIDCRGQLSFGQRKDGKSIFTKRMDKDTKKPMPSNGWYHWSGQNAPAHEQSGRPRQPDGQEADVPF